MCMVAFKGRVSMLQYMKSKPTKWDLKGRVLAGCKTGYVHNWQLYVCKDENGTCTSFIRGFGIYCRVVMNISTDVQPGQVICMDNFFTSVKLFSDLQACNIGACGTVWSNRVWQSSTIGKFQKRNNKKSIARAITNVYVSERCTSTCCWVVHVW